MTFVCGFQQQGYIRFYWATTPPKTQKTVGWERDVCWHLICRCEQSAESLSTPRGGKRKYALPVCLARPTSVVVRAFIARQPMQVGGDKKKEGLQTVQIW